jgi:hypothetical protein
VEYSQQAVGPCGTPSRGPVGIEPASYATADTSPGEPCYAPVFEGSSGFACFFLAIIYLLIIAALLVVWILSFGSKAVWCTIEQFQFRLNHCGEGNSDPDIDLNDPYQQHVHSYRLVYGKDPAWEQWMLANRNRYEPVFERAGSKPAILGLAFRYETAPIAYNPPWADEAEHMAALEKFAELTYAGYDFYFAFNGNTAVSYANVIAGIPVNLSNASGKDIYLYYETIFCHEFGHVMGVLHHYDTDAQIGAGQHMPPGETECLMDRNSNQYCSACRTALFIPLNVDNSAAIDAAATNIFSRYPY